MVEWKCTLLLLSYCCHILKGKDISAMRHDVAVKIPCVQCTVVGNNNKVVGRPLKYL